MTGIFPSWQTVSGPSPIDWCEANFDGENSVLLGVRVAEYHNTYTNGAYVMASLLLLWVWWYVIRGVMTYTTVPQFVLCLLTLTLDPAR